MKIGQRHPEDEMHKRGSYFIPVPKPDTDLDKKETFRSGSSYHLPKRTGDNR